VIKTWIDTGSTQPEKLQDRLRSTIMVRRVKSDALPELPAKIRQIISLEPDTKTAKLLKTERGLVQKSDLTYAEYTELAQTLTGEVPGFQDMARIRREIGIIKMRIALPHLNEVIENNDKVIIFAHHVEIIQRLMIEFGYKATGIYGAVPPKQRVKNIYNFQNDPDKRVFVGNIKAAGVGINLTAASVVIFLEHAWTPDATNQAEDRAHRMGQKDTVHVQHLVLKDSLDSYMVRTIIRKQEMIDKIINQKKEEENGSTD